MNDKELVAKIYDIVNGDVNTKYGIPSEVLMGMTEKNIMYDGGFVNGFGQGMLFMANMIINTINTNREKMENIDPDIEV